jgi:antitoxin ParD1/3/4
MRDQEACINFRLKRETRASREALESWLQSQVGPAYDALKADPSRAITVDEIRATLAIEHERAVGAAKHR